MKKIFVYCIITSFTLLSHASIFAYTPSSDIQIKLDEIVNKIQNIIAVEWEFMRLPIIWLLEEYKIKKASNEKAAYILNYVLWKIVEGPKKLTLEDFPNTYKNITVVNKPPQTIATVINRWSLWQRNDDSFEYLSWFIFWDNTNAAQISMTSPVTREKIANNQYETAFIMPQWRTLDNLPNPNNDRVSLKEIPWWLYAVRKFSWYTNETLVNTQWDLFTDELRNEGITWYWLPTLAQYDWPRVASRARRNELWVSLNR